MTKTRDPQRTNLDAGQLRRARVVANGEDSPPEHRPVQAPLRKRADDDEHNDGDGEDLHDRQVMKNETTEHSEIVGKISARRSARPHHRNAVDRQQRAERGDDRRRAEISDDGAIDESDEEANRVEDGDRPPRIAGIVCGQHRPADDGQRYQRPNGKVEASTDQHEDLPCRKDRERRRTAKEIHRAGRFEVVRLQQADHEVEE